MIAMVRICNLPWIAHSARSQSLGCRKRNAQCGVSLANTSERRVWKLENYETRLCSSMLNCGAVLGALWELDRFGVIFWNTLRQREDDLIARALCHRSQQIQHPLDLLLRCRGKLPDADFLVRRRARLLVVAGEFLVEFL